MSAYSDILSYMRNIKLKRVEDIIAVEFRKQKDKYSNVTMQTSEEQTISNLIPIKFAIMQSKYFSKYKFRNTQYEIAILNTIAIQLKYNCNMQYAIIAICNN